MPFNTEMWRRWQRFTSLVCLSSLVSLFSRLSRSVHVLSLSSLTSSTPQYSQSMHGYTWCMKRWIACHSYFIVLKVRTHDVWNHDRLEWLLNRISSFSQPVHVAYETMTDYRQCGARSGSPQLFHKTCTVPLKSFHCKAFSKVSVVCH